MAKKDAKETAKSPEEKIARLLAILLVKDSKADAAKFPVLRSAGFTNAEIADILGTTEDTVRVALNRTRKKKKR